MLLNTSGGRKPFTWDWCTSAEAYVRSTVRQFTFKSTMCTPVRASHVAMAEFGCACLVRSSWAGLSVQAHARKRVSVSVLVCLPVSYLSACYFASV